MFALPVLLAATLAFPQPIVPPRPVSEITWSTAAGSQSNPVMDSNGSISFVAWSDRRVRNRFSLGTRVGSDGTPLDPLGVTISAITYPEVVVWTGTDFAVIGQTQSARAVVFVKLDGTSSEPNAIDIPREYSFATVSGSGSDARLLFIHHQSNTTLTARIVSPRGERIADIAAPLTAPLALPPLGSRFIATGRRSDFAIFAPSATLRLDREGHVLANTPVTWPFQYFFAEFISVAGNDGQGFILLRESEPYSSTARVVACQLDNDAVFTGKSSVVEVPWVWRLSQSRPVVAAAGDGYIVVNAGIFGDNTLHTYVTRLSFDLIANITEVPNATSPIVLHVRDGLRLLVATTGGGLVAQALSESLDPSTPQLLAVAATSQTAPVIAVASTNYAVAWGEAGTDAVTHTYIRRFTLTGEPLDALPIEVDRPVYGLAPTLAATADVYVVNGRRLNAFSGEWIDAASKADVIAAASNGRDALLVLRSGGQTILQRLPSFGTAPSGIGALPDPGSAVTYQVGLASNGTDYLIAWNVVYSCFSLCAPLPTPVYALRVRADGAWIDSSPIQLSADGANPSVAWNEGTYLVTWRTRDGIRGSLIAAEGTASNSLLIEQATNEATTSAVVPFNRDFLAFVHHMPYNAGPYWTALRLRSRDLAAVRVALQPIDGQVGAASFFGKLVVAFDDSSDPKIGYVPRVYVQHFADTTQRRRTGAR